MAKMSEEVKKIISETHPAMVATAGKNGKPNVSPRGSFRVLDDEHVVFSDGGRMYTLANLRGNPKISAIIYNAETRQGCRIWGTAEILESGEMFEKMAAEAAARGITLNHVVRVKVEEEATF
jgi:predicted pyridoxine 5'-phosphate oxidase superfamily flavin-nucleotide-binding protein